MYVGPLISRDGRTIVGTLPDSAGNLNAAIWQGGRNWRLLPPFPEAVPSEGHVISNVAGVSGDGTVIVGGAYVSTTKVVAFRWDAMNGMVNLGIFDEGTNSDSRPYGISADGRSVIGWDYKEGFSPAWPRRRFGEREARRDLVGRQGAAAASVRMGRGGLGNQRRGLHHCGPVPSVGCKQQPAARRLDVPVDGMGRAFRGSRGGADPDRGAIRGVTFRSRTRSAMTGRWWAATRGQ